MFIDKNAVMQSILYNVHTYNSKLMREDYVEMTGLRPGVTRLSFPYFLSQAAVEYVVKAVEMVAKHGWKLLPQVTVIFYSFTTSF